VTLSSLEARAGLAGPARVVAGAGTGKTAVIADRFRRLVEAGVEPRRILVMTFTERAARQMRERIADQAPGSVGSQVGTFHALALGWLREDGERVGVRPGFEILTGPDRWILMRELLWQQADPALVGLERPDDLVSPLLGLLERLKQELVQVPRLAAWAERDLDQARRPLLAAAARLFEAYGAATRRERLLDFDDLIVLAVRLLEGHPEVRARYAERFPWVMVDEYQDTNLAQERMVELLAGPSGNVFVVGDDDQSIYRFRGASRASLERFLSSFPQAQTQALGRNRRSSPAIVLAARSLIERNADRVEKGLSALPSRTPGVPVEVWRCETAAEEAAVVVGEIVRLAGSGTPLAEVAVLTRTHAVARPLVAALAAAGMPYRQAGGRGLYSQPEVRDVIAYLRLLHDPSDLLALARLLSRPPLSLDLASALEVVRETSPGAPLRALAGWEPCASWAAVVQELTGLKARLGVNELLFEVLDRLRFLERVAPPESPEGRRAAAGVSRFAELVDRYCERRRDHSLSLFVEYLDLVLRSGLDEDLAVGEEEDGGDAVQVMTIHQAKGLEFEAVFVPALVEGRLPQPHRRGGLDGGPRAGLELPPQLADPRVRGREDHVAEERRLCYVAMTRARSRLVLSWAERYEGARPWRPSRFLGELGPGVVEVRPRLAAGAAVEGMAAVAAVAASAEASGAPEAPSSRPSEAPPAALASRGQESGEEAAAEAVQEAGGGAGAEAAGEDAALSFSSISAYRECPRQHWYRYRLRLPAAPAVEAQFGTILHLALMRAGHMRRQDLPVGRALLRELYQEAWETVGLSDPRRRPALESLGWRLLEAFQAAGGLDPRPWLLEAPFTATLDTHTLRGIIDRVDRHPPTQEGGGWAPDQERGAGGVVAAGKSADGTAGADPSTAELPSAGRSAGEPSAAELSAGEPSAAEPSAGVVRWRIVDYKTGSPQPQSRLRRDLQLALYAAGARSLPGIGPQDPLELEIVYLRDGRRVTVEATPELVGEAVSVAGEVAEGVRAGRFEARPERRRCSLCPYRLACDAAP
jgi:DNA helicase II / ATP-dependent DNA helicase PcrA